MKNCIATIDNYGNHNNHYSNCSNHYCNHYDCDHYTCTNLTTVTVTISTKTTTTTIWSDSNQWVVYRLHFILFSATVSSNMTASRHHCTSPQSHSQQQHDSIQTSLYLTSVPQSAATWQHPNTIVPHLSPTVSSNMTASRHHCTSPQSNSQQQHDSIQTPLYLTSVQQSAATWQHPDTIVPHLSPTVSSNMTASRHHCTSPQSNSQQQHDSIQTPLYLTSVQQSAATWQHPDPIVPHLSPTVSSNMTASRHHCTSPQSHSQQQHDSIQTPLYLTSVPQSAATWKQPNTIVPHLSPTVSSNMTASKHHCTSPQSHSQQQHDSIQTPLYLTSVPQSAATWQHPNTIVPHLSPTVSSNMKATKHHCTSPQSNSQQQHDSIQTPLYLTSVPQSAATWQHPNTIVPHLSPTVSSNMTASKHHCTSPQSNSQQQHDSIQTPLYLTSVPQSAATWQQPDTIVPHLSPTVSSNMTASKHHCTSPQSHSQQQHDSNQTPLYLTSVPQSAATWQQPDTIVPHLSPTVSSNMTATKHHCTSPQSNSQQQHDSIQTPLYLTSVPQSAATWQQPDTIVPHLSPTVSSNMTASKHHCTSPQSHSQQQHDSIQTPLYLTSVPQSAATWQQPDTIVPHLSPTVSSNMTATRHHCTSPQSHSQQQHESIQTPLYLTSVPQSAATWQHPNTIVPHLSPTVSSNMTASKHHCTSPQSYSQQQHDSIQTPLYLTSVPQSAATWKQPDTIVPHLSPTVSSNMTASKHHCTSPQSHSQQQHDSIQTPLYLTSVLQSAATWKQPDTIVPHLSPTVSSNMTASKHHCTSPQSNSQQQHDSIQTPLYLTSVPQSAATWQHPNTIVPHLSPTVSSNMKATKHHCTSPQSNSQQQHDSIQTPLYLTSVQQSAATWQHPNTIVPHLSPTVSSNMKATKHHCTSPQSNSQQQHDSIQTPLYLTSVPQSAATWQHPNTIVPHLSPTVSSNMTATKHHCTSPQSHSQQQHDSIQTPLYLTSVPQSAATWQHPNTIVPHLPVTSYHCHADKNLNSN